MMNLSCTTEYVGRPAKISLWQTISRNKPQLNCVAVCSWLFFFFPCLVLATIHSQFQLRKEMGEKGGGGGGGGQIQKHSFIQKVVDKHREILRTSYQLTSSFLSFLFFFQSTLSSTTTICKQCSNLRVTQSVQTMLSLMKNDTETTLRGAARKTDSRFNVLIKIIP